MKDFKFVIGTQSYNATVSELEEGQLEVSINGKAYHVTVPARKSAIPHPTIQSPVAAAAPAGAAPVARQAMPSTASAVVAPLPGTITKVVVAQGAKVKKGDVVVVMEAMKMANDIVAECDGTVTNIRVTEGQSVNQGDIIIDLQGAAAAAAPAAKPVAAPAPAAPAAPAVAAGANMVTAPLPGTIKQVLVKVGDKVNPGDTVLTMEAMKMENNITAEFGGTVKNILVQEGAQVQSGAPMVELA